MFAACNNKVIELTRIQLGYLPLKSLKIGKWKELTQDDIKLIFNG